MLNGTRIGVYVCHCGSNIAGKVDVKSVAEFANSLPGVAVSRDYLFMCSDPGQEMIGDDIQKHDLNRVVVASCSPLMHEKTFRATCARSGLNQYLLQMANIREQCSWITDSPQAATGKAKALVAGSVGRARALRPLKECEVSVEQAVLVVGGGIAGIQAALQCADADYKVHLVERSQSIGGHMARFDKTFPTLDCAACILTPKMVQVGKHPNINLMTYSEVEEVGGHVGRFRVKVRKKARYVHEDKCNGCNQCLDRCPVQYQPFAPSTNGRGYGVPVEEPSLTPELKSLVDRAVEIHNHERGPLISVLQDVNADTRYFSEEVLRYVSVKLGIPLARVYHVASFYTAFSLIPRGKHIIKVCTGSACHVKGSSRILDALESQLEIRAGETTRDRKFTLETVNCLGSCAIAPVVTVDSRYNGKMTARKVEKMLAEYE